MVGFPDLARLVHRASGYEGTVVVELGTADLRLVPDQRVDTPANTASTCRYESAQKYTKSRKLCK